MQSGWSMGLVGGSDRPPHHKNFGRPASISAMNAPISESWGTRTLNSLQFWKRLPRANVMSEADYDIAYDRIRVMQPEARQLLIDTLVRQNDALAKDVDSV